MNLLTNSKFISFVWWVLAPVLAALLFNLILVSVLEKQDTKDVVQISNQKVKYLKYFPKFLISNKRESKRVQPKIREVDKLGKITLQACYAEKNKKFIVFKEGKNTVFLDLKQSYKNAKLIDVGMDYAVFLKHGKKIELKLEGIKPQSSSKKVFQKSVQQGNYIDVKRDDLKKYTKNIRRALRDIRVQELRKDKKFAGVRLSFIRKGSLFDKMNLKVGDVIKSIDGNELKSMMDLLPYYNRINDTATLQIGFERGNEMKEIVYEIN